MGAVGGTRLLAQLAPVQPQRNCRQLDAPDWPVADGARDGWSDGLPDTREAASPDMRTPERFRQDCAANALLRLRLSERA